VRRAAVVAGALVVAGCGSGEPADRVAAAARETQRRTPVKFGQTFVDVDAERGTCRGAIDLDRRRMRQSCRFGGEGDEFHAIVVGDVAYTRWPVFAGSRGDGRWDKATHDDEMSSPFQIEPSRLLSLLRRAAASTDRVGREDVRGVRVTHYRLLMDTDRVETPLPRAPEVDVWIDDDDLVRRIRYGGSAGGTIEFFDFGEPVAIDAPPASEVREAAASPFFAAGDACPPTQPLTVADLVTALRRRGAAVDRDALVCRGGTTVVSTRDHRATCLVHRGGEDARVERSKMGRTTLVRLANVECAANGTSVATVAAAVADLERSLR